MIIVKLWGGMGNQLFQYAFGYSLAKKHNDSLRFDTKFYNNQPKHVGKRNIVFEHSFQDTDFLECKRPKEVLFFENKYVNKIIRIFRGFGCLVPNNCFFYKEWTRHYCEKIPYYSLNTNYYDGYWQSAKYFFEYREELLRQFTPSQKIRYDVERKMKCFSKQNTVAIHIRRGDYLLKKNMPAGYTVERLMDYYYRAIEYMASRIDNPVFCFFSDDIGWCKEAFKQLCYRTTFIENVGEEAAIKDLFCISKCKHGIMSPSTFSWWGNWLRSDLENSIIVAPKGNYGNNCFIDEKWIVM